MFVPEVFVSASLRAHVRGASVTRVCAAAFNAVHAGAAVERFVRANPLPPAARTFAFGLGKAAPAMTAALAEAFPLNAALIIAKRAPAELPPNAVLILGDHPVPGAGSLQAGRAALDFVSQLTPDDLLVCLISGGGSALMSAPLIPLEELQRLTSILLANGASIDQINVVRRHLDALKGGGLAQAANGAQIISLILSDVTGDALETIASGVTAPDPTTIENAARIADPIFVQLGRSSAPPYRETLKPDHPVFKKVKHHIVASNALALNAAKGEAERQGFYAEIVEANLQGEARAVGKRLAQRLKAAAQTLPRPFCLFAGGETTVTLQGRGKGGRNQEMVLSAALELQDAPDVLFLSIATDGEDGVTDAAGAVATADTIRRAAALGLDAKDHLARNDAYPFFAALGDLLQPGPSGTNVNDLVLLCAF